MKDYLYLLATDQKNGVFAGIQKAILWVLSLLYKLLMICRRYLYEWGVLQSYQISKPVISVGNITLGGVGKTPVVIMLAQELKAMGKKPVILIRGYMSGGEKTKSFSDEAELLRRRLEDVPVLVGRDRVKSAAEYLKNNQADVFIMDDGFQHRRLKRNFDIVAVDALNPWGNGCVLPRGILREPKSSLRISDVICLTKTNLNPEKTRELKNALEQKFSTKQILETEHQPSGFFELRNGVQEDINFIKQKGVAVLSSIGDPKSFAKMVERLGGNIVEQFTFPDHYMYTVNEINAIREKCYKNRVELIITTEKDAVKLDRYKDIFREDIGVYILRVNLKICQHGEQFLERVRNLF